MGPPPPPAAAPPPPRPICCSIKSINHKHSSSCELGNTASWSTVAATAQLAELRPHCQAVREPSCGLAFLGNHADDLRPLLLPAPAEPRSRNCGRCLLSTSALQSRKRWWA